MEQLKTLDQKKLTPKDTQFYLATPGNSKNMLETIKYVKKIFCIYIYYIW